MTAIEMARAMRTRARAVEPEFRKTSREIGRSAVLFTKERMTEEIYSQPIPTHPVTGKPLWVRTHNLYHGEKSELIDAYSVRITNKVPYALPRHEAGKPGHRNVRYPSHWRDELRETFRSIIEDAFRLTIRDILLKGAA